MKEFIMEYITNTEIEDREAFIKGLRKLASVSVVGGGAHEKMYTVSFNNHKDRLTLTIYDDNTIDLKH